MRIMLRLLRPMNRKRGGKRARNHWGVGMKRLEEVIKN